MKDTDTLRDILDHGRSAIVDILWDDGERTGMEVAACDGDDGMVLLSNGTDSELVSERTTVGAVRTIAQQIWPAIDPVWNWVCKDCGRIMSVDDDEPEFFEDERHGPLCSDCMGEWCEMEYSK